MTNANTTPTITLPKEVEVLQKLWESYIAMSTFFSNLVGATLASLIAFPLIKENPGILRSNLMLAGIVCIALSLFVSIAWRWASQWAMEIEIMGGNDGIDEFFKRAQRPRVITGAVHSGVQWSFEKKMVPALRQFMKLAAGIILFFYLLGASFVLLTIRG